MPCYTPALTNANVNIRVLSELDVGAYWQLRLRALREEPESFLVSYEESVGLSLEEVAKKLPCSDNSFVLGAFISNCDHAADSSYLAMESKPNNNLTKSNETTMVGMIGYWRQQERSKIFHKGTIWGTYVIPEYRGHGLGRALMVSAISRASAIPHLEQLMLTVVTTNQAARSLYISMGFVSYGIELKALKLANRYLDEELMVLYLR